MLAAPKKDKYNVQQKKDNKIKIDGYIFDSKIETKYYTDVVKYWHGQGLIKSFKVHPTYIMQDKFEKHGEKIRPVVYEADFELEYIDKTVVIDIKGLATETALLKRKMFNSRYRDLALKWLVYNKKYGGWVEYNHLNKLRREAKKTERNEV